jgi:hypothetical protein
VGWLLMAEGLHNLRAIGDVARALVKKR